MHFVRTDSITRQVETVAGHHRLQGRFEQPAVDFEPGRVARRLLHSPLLLEEQHAEPFEA